MPSVINFIVKSAHGIFKMDNAEDEAVQDFLEILDEHMKNCEKLGKYAEADIARARLDELSKHEENRRKEALRSRQLAERLGIEEAHMLEFQEFNLSWDKKMEDYEEDAAESIKEMEQRHIQELQDFQRNLIGLQLKPKWSKDLINLRRIQETVAKQKNYAEAHKLKMKADTLEAYETEKWHNTRQSDLVGKENKFKLTKQNEINGLLKRITSQREEMKKQRQHELSRLLQRYQNVKTELETQHGLERSKLDKMIQAGLLPGITKKFSKLSSTTKLSKMSSQQLKTQSQSESNHIRNTSQISSDMQLIIRKTNRLNI